MGDHMDIELTNGFKAVIDDEDFELIKGYRWTALNSKGKFYAIATWSLGDGKQRHVLMHRLLLGITDRNVLTDHIDGDGLNNRRGNLRKCNHAENMRNSAVRSHSRSGVKGVRVEKSGNKEMLRVRVRKDGVTYRKWFALTDMAGAEAWAKKMRAELHGEFAYEQGQGASA